MQEQQWLKPSQTSTAQLVSDTHTHKWPRVPSQSGQSHNTRATKYGPAPWGMEGSVGWYRGGAVPCVVDGQGQAPWSGGRAPVSQASAALGGRSHLRAAAGECWSRTPDCPSLATAPLFATGPNPSPHHLVLKGRFPGRQAPCCPLLPELGIAAEGSLVLEPQWPRAWQFLRCVSPSSEWSKENPAPLYFPGHQRLRL